nr:hypothetical protein [uncultured Kingella sp.]
MVSDCINVYSCIPYRNHSNLSQIQPHMGRRRFVAKRASKSALPIAKKHQPSTAHFSGCLIVGKRSSHGFRLPQHQRQPENRLMRFQATAKILQKAA